MPHVTKKLQLFEEAPAFWTVIVSWDPLIEGQFKGKRPVEGRGGRIVEAVADELVLKEPIFDDIVFDKAVFVEALLDVAVFEEAI
jgi:hypothetical protein